MRILALLALSAITVSAWSQSVKGTRMDFVPRVRLSFTERPGVEEFTGRMIARPLQRAAWKRMGIDDVAADFRRMDAEAKLADLEIGYIAPIDCYIIRVPNGMTENSLSRELMRTGLYEYVEPDYRVYPAFVPNDPYLSLQWSHTDNNSTAAWDICRGNSAFTVGLTDTGVHVAHEDLITGRVHGANSATATGLNDVKTEDVYGSSVVKDLNGHGTHTTGIAAATGDNGLGVCGVNITGTHHLMVRVSDNSGGGSSLSALSIGALWAAANGCRVVSTSYTGVQNSIMGTTGTTMKYQYNAVWCYAAGNDGGNYGAQYDWPDVTIVGSIDQNDTRSYFSAYGIFTDVFAPGNNIYSTWWSSDNLTNTYEYDSGTSMATPYAAGVATMILSQNPTYSAQRVEDVLYRSCITMNDANNYGWGRVNLWNAMGRVANSATATIGSVVSGSVTDLYRVEGNTLVVKPGITPNSQTPPVQLVTIHNVPAYANNNYGEISVEATLSTDTPGGFGQNLQLYNWRTGQFETLATGPVTGSYFEGVKTVNSTNYSDYISGGTVKVRTQVYVAGPIDKSTWNAKFDQINVRVLRANP